MRRGIRGSVMEIRALTCPICGAIVSKEKMKCDYCGADLILNEQNMRRATLQCGYLKDNQFCRVIIEEEEIRILREESCRNVLKDSCCFLCSEQNLCEIGCDSPYEPENAKLEDTDQEIKKYRSNPKR
jgi:hypothetical protein